MIDWNEYFRRVVKLNMQFDFAHRALQGWAANPEEIAAYAEAELADLRKLIKESLAGKGDPQKHWIFDESEASRYLESVGTHAIQEAGRFEGRLSQSRFVLRVTIFEAFLKDVHGAILRAEPKLLRADRNVSLQRMIARGWDAVLEQEIEREVQSLDRESVEKKAAYFRKRLGIDWFGGKIVPIMSAVLTARNELLHVNPDRSISDYEGIALEITTIMLPLATVAQAAFLYPKACKLPEHMNADEIKAHLLPKQAKEKQQ